MHVHSMQTQLMLLHSTTHDITLGCMETVAAAGLVGEWRELLGRHAAVSCALERALEEQHQVGLSEFEASGRAR